MMKRLLQSVWNSEKTVISKEYEAWSKQQLIERIKELEQEPTKTYTKEDTTEKSVQKDQNPPKKKKKYNFDSYNTRFVAIKFAYVGWNYNGLAYQKEPTPLPTIEQEILEALTKARLVKEPEPYCCNFSRCGRTDKGVSAMNQVISLDVRSTLTKEEQLIKDNDEREIPYISILNSLLPAEIRITAISLRPPPEFDARFSCEYRHYRYIINKEGLDLERMTQAAAKYKGLHDFRNFCKIDGSKQITNYKRQVYEAQFLDLDENYMVFDLKGSAFLWHQVRCMVAVLLAVGQKHEDIGIVDELLNVEKYRSRPNYEMANDVPLVLYDCVFPEMEWLTPVDFPKTFIKNEREFRKLNSFVVDQQLKAHMCKIMKDVVIQDEDKLPEPNGGVINIGDGRGRAFKKYVPILERDFGEPYDVVNERFLEKRKKRDQDRKEAEAEEAEEA